MAEGPALRAPRRVQHWRVEGTGNRPHGPSAVEVLADRLVQAARAWGDPRVVWLDPGGPMLGEDAEGVLTAFPATRRRAATAEEVPSLLDALVDGAHEADGADPVAEPRLRFAGGWLGYLSYECVEGLEPVRLQARRDLEVPLASWALHPVWYRVLPNAGRIELWSRLDGDPERAPDGSVLPSLAAWVHWAEEAVRSPLDNTTPMFAFPAHLGREKKAGAAEVTERVEVASRSFSRAAFEAAVVAAQEAIREGEVFQANLAQRFQHRTDADPFHVHLALRRLNPSPFAAYLEEDWGALVCNSPERLFRVHAATGVQVIEARPIAGTCAREDDKVEDAAAVASLRASEKERAEHTMLVDLLRNDIGRVAVPGSVQVDAYQSVEAYSHVHHLVSNVCGVLRPGVPVSALVRALFPGGTITGAPKLRSIEVIDRVERVARGPYTGSLGYVNPDGTLDLNILIRTLVFADGRASAYAGAGIVADSDPGTEYDETLHKAAAMLAALAAVDAPDLAQGGWPGAPVRVQEATR